jgi:hypothetical protein
MLTPQPWPASRGGTPKLRGGARKSRHIRTWRPPRTRPPQRGPATSRRLRPRPPSPAPIRSGGAERKAAAIRCASPARDLKCRYLAVVRPVRMPEPGPAPWELHLCHAPGRLRTSRALFSRPSSTLARSGTKQGQDSRTAPHGRSKARSMRAFLEADDGDRTRDPQLGKLMLYRLSYVRARPRLAQPPPSEGWRERRPPPTMSP